MDSDKKEAEDLAQYTAVKKRCPDDATLLVRTIVDGIDGWLCPTCGYFLPV